MKVVLFLKKLKKKNNFKVASAVVMISTSRANIFLIDDKNILRI